MYLTRQANALCEIGEAITVHCAGKRMAGGLQVTFIWTEKSVIIAGF